MTRQPALPQSLLKECRTLMDSLDDDRAAVWVHAGAVAQHASDTGIAAPGPVRDVLDVLAKTHARLEYWGALAAAMPATAATAVDRLWAGQHLMDPTGDELWHSYPVGDLYQALSVEAVKSRALCQTPWWVGELLLHISYTRAAEVWDQPRVIDPSCGTGHILVETYLAALTRRPGPTPPAEALAAVHGVDLDPHAAATAAYRLIVLAHARLRHTGGDLTELPINVAAADSLLADDEPLLQRGQYQVVVANPPYITCKDKTIKEAIRARYPEVCHRQFSLALPFHQLMMDLLVTGGWCAQLTANSFMKREFGKKYVEDYLTTLDSQWVIDTAGAYIPGHGTPTIIMCHRNQAPTSDTIHTVLGIRGEPSQPADPARGVVWTAINQAVRFTEAAERFERKVQATDDGAVDPVPLTEPARTWSQPSLFDIGVAA